MLQALPPEIIAVIVEFLPLPALAALSATAHKFHAAAERAQVFVAAFRLWYQMEVIPSQHLPAWVAKTKAYETCVLWKKTKNAACSSDAWGAAEGLQETGEVDVGNNPRVVRATPWDRAAKRGALCTSLRNETSYKWFFAAHSFMLANNNNEQGWGWTSGDQLALASLLENPHPTVGQGAHLEGLCRRYKRISEGYAMCILDTSEEFFKLGPAVDAVLFAAKPLARRKRRRDSDSSTGEGGAPKRARLEPT